MLSITTVSFIFITWRKPEKHKNHIVFMFHHLSFMLVIQLSYSDSGMPVKRYYCFSYESVLDFLHKSAPWLREWMKHTYISQTWECSALVLDMNKMYPKRCDYLFSFNLNLYLLTLALENLYFKTLDREKVQGKCLGCIKSRGDHLPRVLYTYATGCHRKGMKEPRVADPWSGRKCFSARRDLMFPKHFDAKLEFLKGNLFFK